jgi:carbamoyl-phosphate synthase large subunit
VVVKSPQFSFARLSGADPVLRVEMASTGEVAAFGKTYDEALLKSILSANSFDFSKKSVLLSLGGQINQAKFLEAAKSIERLGYKIFATDTTAEFLREQGVGCRAVRKAHQHSPNFLDIIEGRQVAFVINLSQQSASASRRRDGPNVSAKGGSASGEKGQGLKIISTDGFHIRRAAVDNQIPLFTDLHLARAFVKALENYSLENLEIKSYREYLQN